MARGVASSVAAALANTLLVGRLLDRPPCRWLRPIAACRSVPRRPCGTAVEIIEAYVEAGAPYGTAEGARNLDKIGIITLHSEHATGKSHGLGGIRGPPNLPLHSGNPQPTLHQRFLSSPCRTQVDVWT